MTWMHIHHPFIARPTGERFVYAILHPRANAGVLQATLDRGECTTSSQIGALDTTVQATSRHRCFRNPPDVYVQPFP